MPIMDRAAFAAKIQEWVGDRTDDETLAAVENIMNTYDELSTGDDSWKEKYEENDKAWRKKYRDAFFSGAPEKEEEEREEHREEKLDIKIEDLFNYKED